MPYLEAEITPELPKLHTGYVTTAEQQWQPVVMLHNTINFWLVGMVILFSVCWPFGLLAYHQIKLLKDSMILLDKMFAEQRFRLNNGC